MKAFFSDSYLTTVRVHCTYHKHFHEGRYNPIQQMCCKNGIEKSDAHNDSELNIFSRLPLVHILSLFFFLISSKGVLLFHFPSGNAFSSNFHTGYIILYKYSYFMKLFFMYIHFDCPLYNGYIDVA